MKCNFSLWRPWYLAALDPASLISFSSVGRVQVQPSLEEGGGALSLQLQLGLTWVKQTLFFSSSSSFVFRSSLIARVPTIQELRVEESIL